MILKGDTESHFLFFHSRLTTCTPFSFAWMPFRIMFALDELKNFLTKGCGDLFRLVVVVNFDCFTIFFSTKRVIVFVSLFTSVSHFCCMHNFLTIFRCSCWILWSCYIYSFIFNFVLPLWHLTVCFFMLQILLHFYGFMLSFFCFLLFARCFLLMFALARDFNLIDWDIILGNVCNLI